MSASCCLRGSAWAPRCARGNSPTRPEHCQSGDESVLAAADRVRLLVCDEHFIAHAGRVGDQTGAAGHADPDTERAKFTIEVVG